MARIGVGVSRRDPQRWANLRVGPPEGSQARLSSGGEPVEGRASIPARTAGSLAGGKADREGARAHRVTEGSGLPTGAGTPDREGGSGRGLGFSREARPGRGSPTRDREGRASGRQNPSGRRLSGLAPQPAGGPIDGRRLGSFRGTALPARRTAPLPARRRPVVARILFAGFPRDAGLRFCGPKERVITRPAGLSRGLPKTD